MCGQYIEWIGGYPHQEGVNIPRHRQPVPEEIIEETDQPVEEVVALEEQPAFEPLPPFSHDLRAGQLTRTFTRRG